MNALQIALALIEFIKIVEKLYPESNKGGEKLATVRAMLEQVVGDVSEMWPQLEKLAAVAVKLANAFGVFKK